MLRKFRIKLKYYAILSQTCTLSLQIFFYRKMHPPPHPLVQRGALCLSTSEHNGKSNIVSCFHVIDSAQKGGAGKNIVVGKQSVPQRSKILSKVVKTVNIWFLSGFYNRRCYQLLNERLLMLNEQTIAYSSYCCLHIYLYNVESHMCFTPPLSTIT